MADFWEQTDFWEDESPEELTDDDVVIEQERILDDEESDDEWFNELIREETPEEVAVAPLKTDSYLSTWIPAPTNNKSTVNVSDKAKYAYNYFKDRGLPSHVAAGIVGNLMKESNLNPTIKERGNTGNGRGIAQWDVRNRWKDLQSFASQQNRSHEELDTQLDFVLHEANKRGDLQRTLGAKTPEEAALIFGRTYERPSEKYADWETRQNTARRLVSQQYGGVNNIPDLLEGVSDESIEAYLMDENYSPEFEETGNNVNFGKIAGTIQQGVQTYNKVKNIINQGRDRATQMASMAIDTQNQIAAQQRNASTLRKYNEQKNIKKYQLNRNPVSNALIYS